jgi:hypothetical protein
MIEAKYAQRPHIQLVLAASLSKLKQPGREADNSSLYSADLKKARICTFIPHTSSWFGI